MCLFSITHLLTRAQKFDLFRNPWQPYSALSVDVLKLMRCFQQASSGPRKYVGMMMMMMMMIVCRQKL